MTLSRDSVLFGWSANHGLYPFVGGLPHFTQAGTPKYIDEQGVLRAASAVNTPRFERASINGTSRRVLRLEKASNNIVGDFGTWADAGATRTGGARDPAGGTAGYLLTATGAGGESYTFAAFTGNGTKSLEIAMKAGTAAKSRWRIYDSGAGVVRVIVEVTWTNGTPTLADITGGGSGITLQTPRQLTDGFWLLSCTVGGIVAANTNQWSIYPAATAAGTVYAYFPQAEDSPTPSSVITPLGARTADQHYYDLIGDGATPRALMLYTRFVERGASLVNNARVIQIGKADDTSPRFGLAMSIGFYCAFYSNGTTTTIAHLGALPSYGDTVELLGVLNADGSVAIYQSINGGAVTSATDATTATLSAAWSDTRLYVSGSTAQIQGNNDFADIKIVRYADVAGVTAQARMDELRAFTIGGTFITFTDAIGLATLYNGAPFPGDRFAGWTQSSIPVGDSAPRMSDGKITMFRVRSDYSVALSLPGILSRRNAAGVAPLDLAERLIYHLLNGGTCIVSTGDYQGNYYATCGLRPGSRPSLQLTHRKALDYTLSLELLNLDTVPSPMLCRYVEQ
jgi:hypothetical protein